eukprot:CAMPEP_0203759876 /NCGR_PEP_ID=MMETSP0098-20131031/13185_1 /ASSEMBLY_ACC=CAM_ASM_000208 /TAXON_ID=96639 /ORGANISM=" , Strain NY0313808BC1" /LENGTH=324 /DNA_ID=CAMNT_0050653175 /DNA_START=186 /DNA_END=1157 /DNA_ORIENTATION=-
MSKWYPEFKKGLCPLTGKRVVITGTTSGTGFVAARTCAELGAQVVLLNRPSERATKALKDLKEAVPNATYEAVDCDLMDFASVRVAAKSLLDKFDSIDVLCNNAGVMALPDKATKDGYDVQMQTNHLSGFLLTKELYPLLLAAASKRGEARIVNHSSMARIGSPLDEKYLGKNGGNLGGDAVEEVPLRGPRWDRYHQSKLANMVYTMCLKDKLAGTNIKAVVAHPGFANTSLQSTSVQAGGMDKDFHEGSKTMAQHMEDGAMGILRGIAGPNVESGDFYGPFAENPLSAFQGEAVKLEPEDICTDQGAKDMLWRMSSQAVGEFT